MAIRDGKANAFRLRLALQALIVHFKSATFIRERTMDMLDSRVLKQVLGATARQQEVRQVLGNDRRMWDELEEVFEAAVPSFERRSVAGPDPNSPEFDSPSGPLIAANFTSLVRDIDRVNDLVVICKNILACGDGAQDNAAKSRVDQGVFKIISVCVKVTARGYDGDAGPDEEKWQTVVNDYKKLLINCLQFLNNLVAQNERRKLMLWVQLFDSTTDSVIAPMANGESSKGKQSESPLESDVQPGETDQAVATANPTNSKSYGMSTDSGPFLVYVGKIGLEVRRDLADRGEKCDPIDIAKACQKRWEVMIPEEQAVWGETYQGLTGKPTASPGQSSSKNDGVIALANKIQQLRADFENYNGSAAQPSSEEGPDMSFGTRRALAAPYEKTLPLEVSSYLAHGVDDKATPPPAMESDYRMAYNASYGADILQQGKDDLMKRLDPLTERSRRMTSPPVSRTAEYGSEEDSEDEDFGVPGDDGRGLLTDVPLILGPNEIEVLPMIILSGIVPPLLPNSPGYGSTTEETCAIRNMHTVRCHFLLAQDNGRNLLRELLIFVAAWDLREDELYFKFMVKIMESILSNGLMPFSYHAFRDHRSKDIISPAQAVIMKLLTNIFRARQTQYRPQSQLVGTGEKSPYPTRVDAHMVNFLLTEFRRHIVPQTCALIFLQGQIRAGKASPEEFPLNLWDMERMYEGIYQYLEFFAILTECDAWKQMMAEWEMTSELVTLLKELDTAIPRSILAREMSKIPTAVRQAQAPMQLVPQELPANQAPVAVERPYEVGSPTGPGMPESTLSFHQPTASAVSNAATGVGPNEDEPSDFPWKNLKKLTVLVLSSLTWKNQKVQDQVRDYGGIEVVLNCTKHDDFNPYIREHAVMALRFLVEGNEKNREVVRSLEERAAENVRAKGSAGGPSNGASAKRRNGKGAAQDASTVSELSQRERMQNSIPSSGLFDLMREVMLEMPKRVKASTLDAHKTELLRQLDQEFD
ncbi:hypothetical protein NA57DRAFT_40837 [Rhizodiscina lignyota]|uniref:Ataxin-10 homolog n=1 Tax=Rhizodiscina lignyota TaxID=1504668 RepID=A0A9P4M5R6_9PEZI|nr:hypothetical protein NA57DRAFT_40837 [Rhizodiscina lignyota]